MAPPNNPNTVRVAMIMSRDTRQIVNTFHCNKASGWTLADLSALATLVKNWWTTYYAPLVPAQYALVQVQCRVYNPSVPLAFDLNVSPVVPGTAAGTAEAGNVSLSLSERTGLAGRKYRGRMYLAGLSENAATAVDTVSSTLVAAAASAMANLIVQLFNNSTQLTIFHRNTNTMTDVIAYVIENIIDSQRRRLPGRGR